MLVREAAERLQVHENTVRAWCRDGKLRAVKPGGDKLGYRIPEEEVQRFEAMLRGEIKAQGVYTSRDELPAALSDH